MTSDARGVRVKLADKLEALDMLGKMLGLYRERVEPPPEEKPEPMSTARRHGGSRSSCARRMPSAAGQASRRWRVLREDAG